jgi:hypothetical protein
MNPYYATAFLSASFFWVWPAFLFRSLDARLLTVIGFAAIIFLGAGRLASDFHIRSHRRNGPAVPQRESPSCAS